MGTNITKKNEQQRGAAVDFSLVVLCYRAEAGIIPFIEKTHKLLSQLNLNWELVLVANYNQGIPDKTPDIVRALANRLERTTTVCEPKEGMMGWDLRTGLAKAQGNLIGFIDGDGQFPVESVFSCLAFAQTEQADVVKTYRVSRDDGPYRFLISKVYNCIFSLLFGSGLRDVNSKPKILTRSAYERLALTSDDWFIDAEIMVKALRLGMKTHELPTHFYAQKDRGSFVKPSAIIEFMTNLVRMRLKLNKTLKTLNANSINK